MSESEYGKIQTKETKGGIVEIYDDTKGNITRFTLHPSGTYDSMNDNGDRVQKTAHDLIQVTSGTWEVSVYKDKVEIVSGDSKIELRKNKMESIEGSSDLTINGEKRTIVYDDVTNNYNKNLFQKVDGSKAESVTGDSTSAVMGKLLELNNDHQEVVSGDLSIHVSGNVNVIAGKNATIGAAGITRILGKQIFIG